MQGDSGRCVTCQKVPWAHDHYYWKVAIEKKTVVNQCCFELKLLIFFRRCWSDFVMGTSWHVRLDLGHFACFGLRTDTTRWVIYFLSFFGGYAGSGFLIWQVLIRALFRTWMSLKTFCSSKEITVKVKFAVEIRWGWSVALMASFGGWNLSALGLLYYKGTRGTDSMELRT